MLVPNGKFTTYRHSFEFGENYDVGSDLSIVTDFNVLAGDEVPTACVHELHLIGQEGACAVLYLQGGTITPYKLRKLADELDRAKIEAEKFKDQIKV